MSATTVTKIRGIGWDHERCMAPLRASVSAYRSVDPATEVAWDTRSLKEFGDGNLEALARRYDLLIFDHPYVGAAAKGGWLCDWNKLLMPADLEGFRADSLGPCLESYRFGDGLWGLPVDAAAQVASARPDLLEVIGMPIPRTGDQVTALARQARRRGLWIALPSVPIDAICTFLSLCANLGDPVARVPNAFAKRDTIRAALAIQEELLAQAHPQSLRWNPISCYEHMTGNDDVCYVPFAFGYSNYSRPGRRRMLKFADIPAFGSAGPVGSILGGAGIAISAACANTERAKRYALHLAAPGYQSSEYTLSGGQPASLQSWRSRACDEAAGGFFSGTIQTMLNAYLRPTFDGFVPYFKAAGELIHTFLRKEASLASVADSLESGFLALEGR